MEKNRIRSVKTGKSMRMSYQRQEEVLEMPNLIEVQRDSYKWFLDEGLREVFDDISPIADYSGKLSLEFIDFTFDEKDAKYTIEQCKERDATYAAPLKVRVRLINKETEEINEHEIFMGDLPIMTVTGTFVINGAERVIVSQLVRSPGIYYAIAHDKLGKRLFSSTVIPNRGAWLEYETDSNDVFYVRVDRTRKVPITVLIRALGVGSNAEIIDLFCFLIDQPYSNLQRCGISHVTFFTLLDGIFGIFFIVCEIDEFQTELSAVICNRRNIIKYFF